MQHLHGNHTDAMKMLRTVGFFCFRFALEVDLVAAQTPRSRFYSHLHVASADQTENHPLTKCYSSKGIKSVGAIVQAIAGLPPAALPNSYKAIRREIPTMALAARKHP